MHDVNVTGSHNHMWCTGAKFIKWGLGWFIFGMFFGLGVLIHYLVGSSTNTTGTFLSNVTLWFGSPLAYSAGFIQAAGVAMTAIGAAFLALAGCCCRKVTNGTNKTSDIEGYPASCCTTTSCCPSHRCGSLIACNLGLIALFITGYIGYFIIDAIWPGFYYAPIVAGKNLWLILQGLSTVIFWFGVIAASSCFCKCKRDGVCK